MPRVMVGGVVMGIVLAGAACAIAPTTCPAGARPVAVQDAEGRARWCTSRGASFAAMPAGRAFEGRLGLTDPGALPGGVEGPYTRWYPSGGLHTHGSYADLGARSVPHGLWAFWYPDGRRRLLGHYRRGLPHGCFAAWDEEGTRRTGIVVGDELRVTSCELPDDAEIVAVERGGPPARTAARADATVQAMLGPNQLGARNPTQLVPDPGMTMAVSLTARAHLGQLRIGPTGSARLADDPGFQAFTLGGTIGWRLPAPHPRLDAELATELAVQRLALSALRSNQLGAQFSGTVAPIWTPLAALQLGLSFAVSSEVALFAGARVDGFPARDVDREVIYCNVGCTESIPETWRVGGLSFGAVLGLRVVVR
jgi:hypothetical protein